MKKVIKLSYIDCANCAAKLERKIASVEGVNSASINFFSLKLTLDYDETKEGVLENVKKVAHKEEPDCELIGL